jgi:hypothetical protein
MSGEDKTVVRPVEIPGMQISFSSPIGPSGKGINFVLSAGDDIEFADLNKKLDVIAAAARRQDAFEQLRLDQNALLSNRKLLAQQKAKLVATRNTIDSKVANFPSRRRDADATRAAPQELSAVSQIEGRIFEIEAQIAGCEERIPFWKRLLRGEEPLDLDDDEPSKMAAE